MKKKLELIGRIKWKEIDYNSKKYTTLVKVFYIIKCVLCIIFTEPKEFLVGNKYNWEKPICMGMWDQYYNWESDYNWLEVAIYGGWKHWFVMVYSNGT